jgi:hypothetical protein
MWEDRVTLVSSLTGTRNARSILMDLPRMDTPAIAPPRAGLLGSGMVRSLPAEFPLSVSKGQLLNEIEIASDWPTLKNTRGEIDEGDWRVSLWVHHL